MQTIVINGTSIAWPQRCACCLQPAAEHVPHQRTQSTYLVVATYKKTLTVQVPYCAECAARVRASTAMTGWVQALLVFMVVWFVGSMLAALFVVFLEGSFPKLAAILFPLFSCVAPFVGAALFVRSRRRSRRSPLPAPHVCSKGHAVVISDFGKDSVTLAVSNDQYAGVLQAANGQGGPTAPPSRFAGR